MKKKDFESLGKNFGQAIFKLGKQGQKVLKEAEKSLSDEKIKKYSKKIEKTLSKKIPKVLDEVLDTVQESVKEAKEEIKKRRKGNK